MYKTRDFEFPSKLIPHFQKAKTLEWLSIAYLLSIIVLEYLVMGNIQTMKAVWLEDMLSLIAPISFLITAKIYMLPVTPRFPYGFHSAVKVAFLLGSAALMTIGLFLFIDSLSVLLHEHKPSLPYFQFRQYQIWVGYLIILIMFYKIIAPFFLGIYKIRLAKELHDKTLFVDGHTNRADWLAAIGAILGIIGISLGWWWSDALIAMIVSLDIFYDGFNNTKHAIYNLMDETPTEINGQNIDPLVSMILIYLKSLTWVKEVQLRVREDGHVYFGEALVVPNTSENLINNIQLAIKEIHGFSWRIHDFLICPVNHLSK